MFTVRIWKAHRSTVELAEFDFFDVFCVTGVLWNLRLRLKSGWGIRREVVKQLVLLFQRVKIHIGWGLLSRVLYSSWYALILLFRFIKACISMNSCCDLDLILVSGPGACMCHINTRSRELLKRSEFSMGRGLGAWFICMFPRAVEMWWALIPAAGFCLC